MPPFAAGKPAGRTTEPPFAQTVRKTARTLRTFAEGLREMLGL